MEIGISSASFFAKCLPEDAPELIASLGAKSCELFLNTFSEYDESFFDLLCAGVERSGLKVHSLHPMGTQFEPQLFSMLERPRKDALRLFMKILRGMEKLGASCYIMHGPANLGGAVKNVDFSRIAPILKQYCDIAADFGVSIAFENVSWCLFNTPDFAPKLLNACGNDRLRFTLDIKQAARSGYEPGEFLRAMGERLANVHLCDYSMENNRARTAMIGSGNFDFAGLFRELKRLGYDGPAFIEVYSDLYDDFSELAAALKSLKSLLPEAQ